MPDDAKLTGLTTPPPADPGYPTLAEVQERIQNDGTLSPTRRRDFLSALRATSRILDVDPARLPADPRVLRHRLAALHPAQLGISPKRFANIRADLASALKQTGVKIVQRARRGLTPPWRTLYEDLPSKRLQHGLTRFLHFCDERGLRPDEVDDGVADLFLEALESASLLKNWRRVHKDSCRLWNQASAVVPGWPQHKLAVPSYRSPPSITRETLPLSFREDVDAYLAWLGGADRFCAHPPPSINKPSTVALIRRQIGSLLAGLAGRGHDLSRLCSLADLVDPDTAKEALRHHLPEDGGEPGQYVRDLAGSLFRIARHWVRVGEPHLDQLRRMRRSLGANRTGLTEKNRTMLRQFADEANVKRLLELPEVLMCEALRNDRGDPRSAVKAQLAVALAILLAAPMRVGNLVGLQLDRHVCRPGGRHGPVVLVIPAEEVKNRQELSFTLSRRAAAPLDRYLADFHERLGGGIWLFPGQDGRHKAERTMSQQITETLARHTGLRMTPHQFRHLAAKLILDLEPGNYELVRRLLGHTSLKHTTACYTGLEMESAARHYDELLAGMRERTTPTPHRRPRRK